MSLVGMISVDEERRCRDKGLKELWIFIWRTDLGLWYCTWQFLVDVFGV
jgi:hypothetical protein